MKIGAELHDASLGAIMATAFVQHYATYRGSPHDAAALKQLYQQARDTANERVRAEQRPTGAECRIGALMGQLNMRINSGPVGCVLSGPEGASSSFGIWVTSDAYAMLDARTGKFYYFSGAADEMAMRRMLEQSAVCTVHFPVEDEVVLATAAPEDAICEEAEVVVPTAVKKAATPARKRAAPAATPAAVTTTGVAKKVATEVSNLVE